MTPINEIIKREINPFDLVNLRAGNFWDQDPALESMVESIHKEAIDEIEAILNLVAIDHLSRTVLLMGDAGSGKSYLLGRLKQKLNPKAFFAYIGPWADNDFIWRHILRYTVNSLIRIPHGQQQSQLILWLKSLSVFTKRSLKQKIFNDKFWQILLNDRQQFINHLKESYQQTGIYNPETFFGVLYALTVPELYSIACDWFKGDDLSEESMQVLKVKHCIDNEDAAKNILANFGKISTETQPIVLCFDQVESVKDWNTSPQAIFNINTTLHNDNLKNFLIVISIVTDAWRRNVNFIPQSDKARVEKSVRLKPITLKQAESLWAYRLKPLHQAANPTPNSPIFPLSNKLLEDSFPGGKTLPRNVLILGRQEYQKYKGTTPSGTEGTGGTTNIDPPIDAEFQLLWQKEYKKNQEKYGKISLLPAHDLIQMLQSALLALNIQGIKPKLLNGKFASYSFSYQQIGKYERIGIVWTEDSSMRNFFNVMSACQNVIQQNICQTLYLIRLGGVGTPRLVCHQIYQQIFTHSNHYHIKPHLTSVHYLATYQSLVNSALSQELVLTSKRQAISLQELQHLILESKILHRCTLLQDLGIVPKQPDNGNGKKVDLRPVKDFLLNLVKTQGFMGVPILIKNSAAQFPTIKEQDVQLLIELLCQEKRVKIINPGVKLQDQLICFVA